MKLVKCSYKIHDSYNEHSYQLVKGYAVKSDIVDVKFCIRKIEDNCFKADDFETGFAIRYFFESTKKQAAKAAEEFIKEKVESGEYAKAFEKAYAIIGDSYK